MQGGFGAPTQPGMNTMQPVGMNQAMGAGLGLPGTMGTPQNATGGLGFGAQPQGMTASTGGWAQQQSNPFMVGPHLTFHSKLTLLPFSI